MLSIITNFASERASSVQIHQQRPATRTTPKPAPNRGRIGGSTVYSRVFRWTMPKGTAQQPAKVAIIGSFNNWKPTPLALDPHSGSWHVTLHDIPGGRTHHYMLLVDGTPTFDAACDGYAMPVDAPEHSFHLPTARGPRVLMLFAQTK